MSTPFLAQIYTFSFQFAPKGFAQCNGQLMPINQNQALFALLGTTYGGNGQTTFALPNLKSRVAMHMGNGHTLGESSGQESHTLTTNEAGHSHPIPVVNANANLKSPAGNSWAGVQGTQTNIYSTAAPNASMPLTTGTALGGSQPHNNIAPYLTLNLCIALQGIFPSPN